MNLNLPLKLKKIKEMKIAVIDNYDSFTYNLVHYLEDLNANVTVFRNDEFELNELEKFDKICQTITLDAENGKALLTSIPHPKYPMVMVSLTAKDILLGQMLYETKATAEALVKH